MNLSLTTIVTISLFVLLSLSRGNQHVHKVEDTVKKKVHFKEMDIPRNENHKVQTSFSNEVIEVVDEGKTQCCNETPATAVSDTVVEVFEEEGQKAFPAILTARPKNRDNQPLRAVITSSRSDNALQTTHKEGNSRMIPKFGKESKYKANMNDWYSREVSKVPNPAVHRMLITPHGSGNTSSFLSLGQKSFHDQRYYLVTMRNLANSYKINGDKFKKQTIHRQNDSTNSVRSSVLTNASISHVTQGTAPYHDQRDQIRNNLILHSSSNQNSISSQKHVLIPQHLVSQGSFSSKATWERPSKTQQRQQGLSTPLKSTKGKAIQLESKAFQRTTIVTSKPSEYLRTTHQHNTKRPGLLSSSINLTKHLHRQPLTSTDNKTINQSRFSSEKGRRLDNSVQMRASLLRINKNTNKNLSRLFKTGKPYSEIALVKSSAKKVHAEIPQHFRNSSIYRGNALKSNGKPFRVITNSSSIANDDQNTNQKCDFLTVANALRNTYSVDKSRAADNSLSNSTTAKHLLDLINFFNSFCQTNRGFCNEPTVENENRTNGDQKEVGNSVNITERIILGKAKNAVDFVHLTKYPLNVNHMKKACVTDHRNIFTNNSSVSVSELNRKILQEWIHGGWSKAGKTKGPRFKAGNKTRVPLKKNTLLSNYTKQSFTVKNVSKSGDSDSEMRILKLMRNVSRRELQNLQNYIMKVLQSQLHKNFPQLQSRHEQKHKDSYGGGEHNPQYSTTLQPSSKIIKNPEIPDVSPRLSLKGNHSSWNYTNEFRLRGKQLYKSGMNVSDNYLLRLMRNVSRRELENLLKHIVNILRSNRKWSFPRNQRKGNIIHRDEQHNIHTKTSYFHKAGGNGFVDKQHDEPKPRHYENKNVPKLRDKLLHTGIPKNVSQHIQGQKKKVYRERMDNGTQLSRNKKLRVEGGKKSKDKPLILSNFLRTTMDKTSHRSVQKGPYPNSLDNYPSAPRQTHSTFEGIVRKSGANHLLLSLRNNSVFKMTSPTVPRGLFPTEKARKTTFFKAIDQPDNDVTIISNTRLGSGIQKSDIENAYSQREEDVFQEKRGKTNTPSQRLSAGVSEMTEFVDQALERESLVIKWSHWLPCSLSCGSGAKRKRIQYKCTSHTKDIKDCTVSGEQQEYCKLQPCPVDGRLTLWSPWSLCSKSCGFRGVSVRTRTCIPPRNGGRPCFGEGIKRRFCNRKHCPVSGGLSQWSKFGLCSKTCGGGLKMRRRYCNNPVPQYGGKKCDQANMMEIQSCGNKRCAAKIFNRPQVANLNPSSMCDFDPCKEAGCFHDPEARCITDFECNPVFFDTNGKMLSQCKGMKSLFSRIPDVICSKNPCLSAKCWDVRYQCVVDLECRPIFIGIDKRSIPLGCLDYHGTVRVDRLEGYKNWRTKLAASSTPALTQIMFPPFRPPQVIQPVLRFSNVYTPTVFPHIVSANWIARDQQGITEVEIDEPRKASAYKTGNDDFSADVVAAAAGDDDDDDDDDDNDDDDNDDDYSLGVGYVHDDLDDD